MIRLRYKKSSIFLFAIIVIIGLTVPSMSLAAIPLFGLDAGIAWVVRKVTKLYFYIFISQHLLRMANGILAWVTNPVFIQGIGGYTQNVLVQEGWKIVRDIVNMFFILIMVAVGIAVILRIKNYEIQKILPKIIAVIFLINFSPLICGLIIDASNILMNFFLGAGARGLGTMITSIEGPQVGAGRALLDLIGAAVRFDWDGIALSLFSALMILAFNVFAAFILFMLAMIFLIRYIALWILVILSPLAFFCYILPATKKIWTIWWNHFLQWSFIGVGAAFFLYLAQRMIDVIGQLILTPTVAETQLRHGLSTMVLYSVPLVFLGIGYMAMLNAAPAGVGRIIRSAEKGAKWPTSKQGKATRAKFTKWRQDKSRQIAGPKAQRAISKLASYKASWGQEETKGTKTGRWAKRQAADVVGIAAKMATEPAKMAFGEGSAAGKKVTDEAYKGAKEQDMWANAIKLKTASAEEKVGILRAMGEQKQMKEAIKQKVVHPHDLTTAFKQAIITDDKKAKNELSLAMAHDENVMQKFGKIIEKAKGTKDEGMINGLSEGDRDQGFQSYQDKVLGELRKESDFEKLQMTDDLEEKLGDTAVKFYDAQQLGQAGRTLGRSFVDTIQGNAEEKGAAWFFEMDENTGKARNPHLPRYCTSTAAGNIGYTSLSGADTIKEMEGLQTESRNLEKGISTATTKGLREEEKIENLNNLIEEIRIREEESAHEEIKKILTSARLAAERKLEKILSGS